MKFENIKVNDTVLVPMTVLYEWGKNKTFFIESKVIRVTKTQFVTETNRRFKKDGKEIGGLIFYNAMNKGEKDFYGNIMHDQTEEMNAFKEKLILIQEVKQNAQEVEKLTESMIDNELLDIQISNNALKGIIDMIKEDKVL